MVKAENNILIVSYYFAPNKIVGAKRISYLSHYLTELGFNVHVLTVKQKYNPLRDDSLPVSKKVYRVRMVPPYPMKKKTIFHKIFKVLWEKIASIDPYVGWTIPAIWQGLRIAKKHSINQIICTGPPFSSFFIAYIISRIKHIKLILDYRDPWFLYLYEVKGLSRKFSIWIEEKILRHASKIVFNTEKAKSEYIKQKKIENLEDKSVVIKNAFTNYNDLEPIILESNKKVILYAGNFYGRRSLQYLIKPLHRLFDEKCLNKEDIAIHVFGKITTRDRVLFSQNNFEHLINEHNKVNSNDVLRYMKGADVLYLPQGEDVPYSVAFKFYDYLSVKKPILVVTDKNSAMTEVMKEVDCGEVVDINNTDEVYSALKKILIEQKTYSFNGFENYSWEKISSKFSTLLNGKS
ncbi:MAG TPA: glycosyltransferase family 4 protein [Ignavibacteriaceae bacterium]|nr:glycosyltransferase family 4 protein [Ignavibacteriaceae bacterium]